MIRNSEKKLQNPRKYVIIKDGNPLKGSAQDVAKHIVASLDIAEDEDKKEHLLESYTGRLLGIKIAPGLALKKSPVAGWSYVSRNKKIDKGTVLYTCDTSAEYGKPLVACAPHSENLTDFLEKSSILNYTLGGIEIATNNSSLEFKIQSRDRFNCYFVAHNDIKPGEILTQDYVSLKNTENLGGPYKLIDVGVVSDWIRSGAIPNLMTVKGELVPNIEGKIKTHFIEGVEVEGNTARLKFTVLPSDTQLNPNQKIIGDVGTTLYAYDERLHQAFAQTFGSQVTANPLDIRHFFYNSKIANAIYPPMLLEQTIDKDSKKQTNVTTTIKEIKKRRGKRDKMPLKL